MIKIALTGAMGLVGSRLVELLNQEVEFVPLSQTMMDITNKDQVFNVLKNTSFDIFLHLAAYTNVDGAEKEKELAHKINVIGTKNVFEVVQQLKKKFIYISTDYIFDGNHPPYFEDSQPNPISVYGQTKFGGEKVVGKDGMIVRISYPYRALFEPKKDFFRTFKSYLEKEQTLKLVKDSQMTPTFIDDIAYGLKHLINNYSPEIFHVVGSDNLSPYECAKLVAKVFGLNPFLCQPTTYDEYFKDKAKRPLFAVMKSKKNNFFPMLTFEQGLLEIKKNQH